MGLLVAGITGGASLIKTAQLRSVVTESETYRTAYNTYYSQFSNVPIKTSTTSALGSKLSWEELKTANIIDKAPNATSGAIASKFRGANWFLSFVATVETGGGVNLGGIIADFNSLNVLYVAAGASSATTTNPFVGNDAKSIDDKVDDGVANTGYVRAFKAAATPVAQTVYTATTSDYSLVMKLDF
jgi:hypothetical protein